MYKLSDLLNYQETRMLNGYGGWVSVHIFVFCPTSFSSCKIQIDEFGKNLLGKIWMCQYSPNPINIALCEQQKLNNQVFLLQSWTKVLGHWAFTGINLIHNVPSPPPPRSMLKIKIKKLLVHHSTFNIEWGREEGGLVTQFCMKSSLFEVNNKNVSKSRDVPRTFGQDCSLTSRNI